MSNESVIIEFITTSIEILLQLNEQPEYHPKSPKQTKLGIKINEQFQVSQKTPANWKKSQNRNMSLEF